MAGKYEIRRALVMALFSFYAPQELNTLLGDDRLLLLEADPARIKREWDELTEAGYIRPVEGFPAYRSLDHALRLKLEAGKSLLDNPFFAGPGALR